MIKKIIKFIVIMIFMPVLLALTVFGAIVHLMVWAIDPTYDHKAAMKSFYLILSIIAGKS